MRLCWDLKNGEGSRSRFSKDSPELPDSDASFFPGAALDSRCEAVKLHSDPLALRCTVCARSCEWTVNGEEMFPEGTSPRCPFRPLRCEKAQISRAHTALVRV